MSSEYILLKFFLKIIFITSMNHILIQPDTALFEDICDDCKLKFIHLIFSITYLGVNLWTTNL